VPRQYANADVNAGAVIVVARQADRAHPFALLDLERGDMYADAVLWSKRH